MPKKSKGKFSTRSRKLRKNPRYRGKVSISRILRKFDVGDKVSISLEPSFHKGMPHPRFRGRVGTVVEKRGRAYVVEIKDGRKSKKLTAYAVHLKPVRV